jgi:hypothetical protein
MSLHGKVVAWFVIFAALTVGLFVLGDHFQSTHALRAVLEARAGALASQAAHEVERRYDRAESTLLAFGYARLDGDTDVSRRWSRFSRPCACSTAIPWPGPIQREPVAALLPACGIAEIALSVPIVQRRAGGAWSHPGGGFLPAGHVAVGPAGDAAIVGSDGVVYDHGCVLDSEQVGGGGGGGAVAGAGALAATVLAPRRGRPQQVPSYLLGTARTEGRLRWSRRTSRNSRRPLPAADAVPGSHAGAVLLTLI